jgi:hypothetical protein
MLHKYSLKPCKHVLDIINMLYIKQNEGDGSLIYRQKTILHTVFSGTMVKINSASMFWMSKTWIFVLVEKIYNIACDVA